LDIGGIIMAVRICFISTPNEYPIYREVEVEFEYFSGFAVSQKQKSIRSLHENIYKMNQSLKVLEISTKSTNPVGVELSAFNLKFYDKKTDKEYPIENVFQSSKVFEKGGPYRDILYVHPKDAKRDERLKTSGELIYFNYNDIIWEKEPKTLFYDWLYMSSLYRNKSLSEKILEYNAFTDIEFNHKKSINCQARAAAIFVSLSRRGELEKVLNDKEELKKIYSQDSNNTQLTLFDIK
jgi:type I restriction enzyme M protein